MTLPTTPARRPLAASILASAILASAILASAFLAGSAAAAAGQDGGTGAAGGITSPRVAQDVQRALDAYLVGPGAAAELGCSIAWQADAIVPPGHRLRLVSASPEGVLALNTRNEVTLIRVATGDRAWSATAAQAIDRVLAMDLVTEERDRAFRDDLTILTDTQYFRLDPENGAAVGKERLRQLPVAPPVAYEGRIIYGARSGEAVWLNAATGYLLKASAIDPAAGPKTSIVTTPAIGEGSVVMGSLKGTVVCFDARSGQPFWRRDDLLGGVTATPAIGGDAVYVASADQYLYARRAGRAWRGPRGPHPEPRLEARRRGPLAPAERHGQPDLDARRRHPLLVPEVPRRDARLDEGRLDDPHGRVARGHRPPGRHRRARRLRGLGRGRPRRAPLADRAPGCSQQLRQVPHARTRPHPPRADLGQRQA